MAIETNIDADLGIVLLEKKLLTQQQLQECIGIHKIKGGYLSQHLIEAGYIKDTDLTTCLTCQYGYCYLPLSSYAIDDTALATLPKRCVYDFSVLPIEKNDKLLTVVMSDPLNKGVLEMLRRISQCEIVVFISTQTDIRAAIEKYYGSPYRDFKLNKYNTDNVLRDDLVYKEVSNGLYAGPNRRRYRRLYEEIELEYFAYPQAVRTKTLNISLSGVLFGSNTFIPRGSQMAVNIHIGSNTAVAGVMEVVRFQPKRTMPPSAGPKSGASYAYEVGAFFTFLSEEDQDMLADFLKNRLRS